MRTKRRNEAEAREIEVVLRRNFRFQEIIADISSRFIKTTGKSFDRDIDAMLVRSGDFFEADRSYLFLFSDDNKTMTNTHEWCAEGVVSQMKIIRNQPIDLFPWFKAEIFSRNYVHIPDITALPDEAGAEKKEFSRQDIKSLIAIPIKTANRIWGFIGFDVVKKSYRWSNNEIDNLIVIANIVGDLLLKLRNEEELSASEKRIVIQRSAITELVLDQALAESDMSAALQRIAEFISRILGVARVGIWKLTADGSELHCDSLYEANGETSSSGEVLRTADFPRYFASLSRENRNCVEDAQNDPRTSELTESYLKPLGITSMLDAGIFMEGRLTGVICSEHIGAMRKWHIDEESFLSAVASLVAQLFANAERRKAEAAVRKNESYIRAVMDNLPVGVAVNSVDPAVNFSYMNDSFVSIYRTTREALEAPDNFWNAVYEDPVLREKIRKRVLDDCASGDPARMHWEDIPITREGGKTTFINARNTPLPGQKMVVSTVVDITERKLAEEALADEANRRRTLMEQSRDGIVILHQDGRVYEANRKFAEMLGCSPDETSRLNVVDWEFSSLPERTIEMLGTVDEKGDHFETRHRRKDGSVYDVAISTNAAWFAGEKLVFCLCRDITERKQTEEKIRRSETLLQRLLELHRLAKKTTDDVLNHTMESSLQVSESKFAFLGLLSEDESKFTISKWSENLMAQRAMIEGKAHFPVAGTGILGEPVRKRAPVIVNDYAASEKRKGYPPGHFAVKRFLGIPVISGNKIVAICGVANKTDEYNEADVRALDSLLHEMWNIIELKTREDKLRKLSRAVEQSPVTVMITDLDGNIEYVNSKFADITGYTIEEALGHNPRILKSGEQPDEYYRELWETISSGREWKGEFRNRKRVAKCTGSRPRYRRS